MLDLVMWLGVHGPDLVSAVVGVLSAMIAVALIIPGEQPEKALQSVVDWLKKLSRK